MRWVIGVAVGLAVLHWALVLLWGPGEFIAALPWYVPMMHSFLALAAFSVAFLALGRFQVLWEPTPFWIGAAFIVDPTVAYLPLTLGIWALVAEFYHPGAVLPGVTGVTCLILAFAAFGSLPIDWAGVALIVLAVVLFVLDIKVTGFGLTAGGVVAFVLGSLMLFRPFVPLPPTMPPLAVAPWLIAAMTGLFASFFVFVVSAGLRARRANVMGGDQALIGARGRATSDLAPRGTVLVQSEDWTAEATSEPIEEGETVRVVGVDGVNLRVIEDISLDDVLAKREHINQVLRVKLDEVTQRWGNKVTAVEIREIVPPREVQEAMTRQMSAERNRRAMVSEADGKREAAIKVAEGEKQATILKAEGDRQAAIPRAEGFSLALGKIFEVAKTVDAKTMSLQYLEALKALGRDLPLSSCSPWSSPAC